MERQSARKKARDWCVSAIYICVFILDIVIHTCICTHIYMYIYKGNIYIYILSIYIYIHMHSCIPLGVLS